jgi:surface-anchored protein
MKIHKLAILAAASVAIALNSASAQALWNAGHGDLGIGYDDLNMVLDPHVHIHTGATVDNVVLFADEEYAPGDALPQIAFAKSLSRPPGAAWDFFGVSSGQPVWIFPATEDPSLPFIGFGAEELVPADWSTAFTITLTGLAGSGATAGGKFSVYQTDGFGTPTVSIQTNDGISGADAVSLAAGGHAHYNIAFTQPGIYEATFHITGTHAVDGAKSADATYKFEVVPEPTSFALLALGGGALLLRRWRKAKNA